MQAVTTARLSVEEDRHRRMRNYLVAMGLRIAGFPVAVWLLLNGYVALGVVLAVLATVIPSIAVGVANAVDRRGTSTQDATPVSPVQGLGPAPRATEETPAPSEPRGEQIRGTVVSSRETPHSDPASPGRHGPADADGHREAS
ncbi:hypothetical protein GCM10011509_24450 [Ornithinimicrobium pekingense]|uniref:DUF3099 domain-containing protein n=1 Tax=Ornithinimicrobium pekingense TaxID=384677 RepID=A0ABQ2F9L1_9MICO|nr:hypothetical protein GCM10011509_24450 [Ornithinimicrobium pekingense]